MPIETQTDPSSSEEKTVGCGRLISTLALELDTQSVLLEETVHEAKEHRIHFELNLVRSVAEAKSRLVQQPYDALLYCSDGRTPIGPQLEALRSLAPELPVVVVSDDDDDTVAALKLGADDFASRSIRGVDLALRIIHNAERRRISNDFQQANHALTEANAKLRRLVQVDPLTNVLNRRGFERALQKEASKRERSGSDMVAILLDCDDFKQINDRFGHATGDMVLQNVSRAIMESVRPSDHIARVGGDEFMVLLPDTRFPEAMLVAERLRLAIAKSPDATEEGSRVTASLGVAHIPADVRTVHELFTLTRLALTASKRRGKNQVAAQETESLDDGSEVSPIAALVSGAQLHAIHEPIIRIRDGSIVGVEMLSRGPEGPFHMPSDFFRLAIDAEALPATDLACLRTCVRQAEHISTASRIHLNMFPTTVLSTPVGTLIDAIPDDGRIYCIELSERQLVGDPGALAERVEQLKEAGLQIAIDDVGSGRSCLETLLVLMPDVVKIDSRYVSGAADDARQLRALERLLRVVSSLDAEVIAEGCEREEEIEILRTLGVRYAQGRLFDRGRS